LAQDASFFCDLFGSLFLFVLARAIIFVRSGIPDIH